MTGAVIPSAPRPPAPSPAMPPKFLNLIVACAENRVIGRGGQLPWHIPEDQRFFHAQTAGQTCVLGRICYETWLRVRADGRRPIVISRRTDLAQPGVVVVPDLAAALAAADALPGEAYICGGERIYGETLALARPLRLHLTLVHAEIPGDTFMPEWRHLPWRETARRESADAGFRLTFSTWEKP